MKELMQAYKEHLRTAETPRQWFIRNLAEVTGKTKSAAASWVDGKYTPRPAEREKIKEWLNKRKDDYLCAKR